MFIHPKWIHQVTGNINWSLPEIRCRRNVEKLSVLGEGRVIGNKMWCGVCDGMLVGGSVGYELVKTCALYWLRSRWWLQRILAKWTEISWKNVVSDVFRGEECSVVDLVGVAGWIRLQEDFVCVCTWCWCKAEGGC